MALPEIVTGAVAPTTAWVPPEPLEVSAAFAAAVPASQRPPTQRVNHNPLDTYLFMGMPFMLSVFARAHVCPGSGRVLPQEGSRDPLSRG